jgi:polar amino acid transport system permease protein
MNEILAHALFIGSGVALTLKLLCGGFAIGLVFGIIFSVLSYNGYGRFFIKAYISVIRGTPLMLQLALIYFTVPVVTTVSISVTQAGILAFGLNSSAYVAEIFRAGIESIPQGQFEAAKTLQIPSFFMWKDIIFPQVLANIFPAMVNEIIALLKETALIGTIGGLDIMRASHAVAAQLYTYFGPLCVAGLYYYGLVLLIERVGRAAEKRWFYDKN